MTLAVLDARNGPLGLLGAGEGPIALLQTGENTADAARYAREAAAAAAEAAQDLADEVASGAVVEAAIDQRTGLLLLATGFSSATVNVDIDQVRTAGYSTTGLGAATYVADSLADAALVAAHPLAAFTTANGRHFRLLPENGMILATQLGAVGDPAGLGAVNDQPAFKAALAYCKAIGCGTIGIDRDHSWWAETRTTAAAGVGWDHETDGHFLVIEEQQIAFVGIVARKPWIRLFNVTGDSFDGTTPGTNFQVVEDTVFRGAAFFVATEAVDPGADSRSRLRIEYLRVDGGAGKTSDFAWPADPADGDGGDITHHMVFVEPTGYGGTVEIVDAESYNFRGGHVYGANQAEEQLHIRDYRAESGNENGVNPNSCVVDIDGLVVKGVFQGYEGTLGEEGKLVHAVFIDCFGVYGSSGSAGFFQGGEFGSPTHAYPARINASIVPRGQLDVVWRHCSTAYPGCWLDGRIVAVDTTINFGNVNAGPGGAFETDLHITLVSDQTDNAKVIINGGAGSAGDKRTDRLTLRIDHIRTSVAIAGGNNPSAVVDYYGSLGPDIRIHLMGAPGDQNPVNSVTLDDYAPQFTGSLDYVTFGGGAIHNAETTAAIDKRCPVIQLTTTNTGTFTATMPSTNIATGTECLLVNTTSNASIQFNGNNIGSSKVRYAGFVVIPPGHRQRMRFDGGLWVPIDGVSPVKGIHTHGGTAVTMGVHEQNAIALFSNASNITYTVPLNSTLAVPVGSTVEGYVSGAGLVTIAATGGVTIRTPGGSLATLGQYSRFRLTKVATDTWVLDGATARIETLSIRASQMVPRTTNGCAALATSESATNKIMRQTLDFDASTDEFAQVAVPMPKGWDEGTIQVQFVWEAPGGTGNVVWGAQAVALSDDDVIDAAFGTAQTVTDGVTATTDLMQSAYTSAITIAGTPAAEDTVMLQIYRDADNGSDTLASDAKLIAVRVKYTRTGWDDN